VKNFRLERPPRHYGHDDPYTDKSALFIGALTYIEQESGLPIRTLNRIIRQEYKTVSLRIADQVLGAIDREYLLVDGLIPVIPNPQWSYERYVRYMQERGCF
jgi:hypothetical protein